MSDRLHDTLSSLRTDVDSARLADSSAVRARGNQRTRRQAVGTSLAVVALVAGAVGIGGALIGTNKATNLPADDPTVSTSQTPAPEPTTQAPLELDDRVLLTAEELPEFPNQSFSVGETLDPATSAEAEERFMTACGGPPSAGATPASAIARTFFTDLDATMWQWVAQYATADEVDELFTDLMAGCTDSGATVVELGTVGTETDVPGGFRASKFSVNPGSEFNGDIVGVARIDNTIVVIGLRAMVRENEVDLDAFDAAVVDAADRIAAR